MRRAFAQLPLLLAASLLAACGVPDSTERSGDAFADTSPEAHLRYINEQLEMLEPHSPEARELLYYRGKLHRKLSGKSKQARDPGAFLEALAQLKTTRDGETYPPNYQIKALSKAKALRTTKGAVLPWQSRGPGNVSGRVRALVVDVSDISGNTWFAASIGGGIWKTTNAGLSWQDKTPELTTLTTSSLVQSQSNPDIFYAGTGMGYGRVVDLTGSGVWKSTDHGETWFQLASTANGQLLEAVNRIVVDPNNPNIVLVCSNDGFSHLGPRGGQRLSAIFRSTNGGQSWTQVFNADAVFGTATDNRVQQIIAQPGNFNNLLASVNEVGVIKSTNAGVSWVPAATNFALPSDIGNPTSGGFGLAGISVRTELAVSPSDPNRVYAAVERPRGIGDLYMSQDFGNSWNLLNDLSGDPNWFSAFGTSGAVGYTAAWFDNTLAVHPFDPNTVFLGGVNIYQAVVSPGALTRVTTPIAWWVPNGFGVPPVHADHHWLQPIPAAGNNFRLIDGNDGGVAVSPDGGTQWFQGTGMVTTQFYGVDKMPGADVYIGGMQDNGTWRSGVNPGPGSNWSFSLGGDGFEVVWNGDDPDLVLATQQGGSVNRSIDSGFTFQLLNTSAVGVAAFITRIANSKADPDLVFTIGFSGVLRSDDFGLSWTLTGVPGNWLGFRPFDNIEVSVADPQIVWISSRMDIDPASGLRGGIHVSDDGGLSFTEVSNNFPANLTEASGMATDPFDPDTAYMLFATPGTPKIMRTTNLGQNWEDLSGFATKGGANGFPDVPVFDLLVMPFDTNVLWAGTDIGLFISEDDGATWQVADNGLPNAAIFEMSIVDDEVLIATQGRGIWTVQLPELSTYAPPDVTLAPRLKTLAMQPNGNLRVTGELRSEYDSSVAMLDGVVLEETGENFPGQLLDTELEINQAQILSAFVVSEREGREYRSATKSVRTFVVDLADSYDSALNTASAANDFVLSGMSVTTPIGFNNRALHTPHPYTGGTDFIAQLKTGLAVPCSAATLAFDEIVIVEPGTGSGVFGDPQFWDFVIVEGTADGVNWLPLADGYDARADATWLSTYNAGGNGTAAMFRNRVIDVSDTFAPGERIFIRFRLSADGAVEGWGWAIDNIDIFPDGADLSCLTAVNLAGISGAWSPDGHDGEGWFIEALGDGRVTVYWFTYGPDGGRQAWMVGVGEFADGVITVDAVEPLFQPIGGIFGPTFDPDAVVLTPWGPVVFVFDGCGGGIMSFAGPPEFGSGEYPFSRITGIGGVECRLVAPESAGKRFSNKVFAGPGISGSWFDPTHAGEGWIIEILPGGGVVMAWFTYDDTGEQAWLVGTAGPEAFDGKTITLTDVQITNGPIFGPGFDEDSVQRIHWGTATFSFSGCNSGTMTYASVLPEFGSGSLNLERLTALADTDCTE